MTSPLRTSAPLGFPVAEEIYHVPVPGPRAGVGEVATRCSPGQQTRKLQEDVLRIEDETLRALSTPLLPSASGVLVMPLVGEVSRERTAQGIETLHDDISRQQARIAILDVTGVPQAGPSVADALVRTAWSVRLLGAEVVLTRSYRHERPPEYGTKVPWRTASTAARLLLLEPPVATTHRVKEVQNAGIASVDRS
ncbi:STAS domain-containing protein [Sorangium sp. So ce1151]|uniref:STAS domain-containing protein n=1 Tax=Sorangium sp. So ce1151 TaxID=3133332 RepID=UPI003F5F53F1